MIGLVGLQICMPVAILEFDVANKFLIMTFLMLKCSHTPKLKSSRCLLFKLSSSQDELDRRSVILSPLFTLRQTTEQMMQKTHPIRLNVHIWSHLLYSKAWGSLKSDLFVVFLFWFVLLSLCFEVR